MRSLHALFILVVICWYAPVRAQPRASGPAVVHGGLDERGRVLSVGVHPEYWAAYDLQQGSLFRVWKGSLDTDRIDGVPGYPGHAALRGQVLQRDDRDAAWRLRLAGRDTAAVFSYVGYRLAADHVVLSYAVSLGDSVFVRIDETPQLVLSEAGQPEMRRRFVVVEATPGVEVLHRIDVTHLASRDAIVYDGLLLRTHGKRHRHVWGNTYDVAGWIVMPAAGRPAVLTTRFEPDMLRQVARDDAFASTASFQQQPPVRLRTLAELESGPTLVRSAAHAAGVTLQVYDIGQPMDSLATLAPGQLPNVHRVHPDLDFRTDADFGGASFYFVTQVTGYLNLAVAGDYAFRLVADDGARLTIADTLLIDYDGRHPAEPSPPATIALPVGVHPLVIDHFQSTGGKRLALEWKPPWATVFAPVDAGVLSTPHVERAAVSEGRKLVRTDAPAWTLASRAIAPRGMHPAYRIGPVAPRSLRAPVGGLAMLSDGRLAVSTWHDNGAVYLVDPRNESAERQDLQPYAEGLASPLGLVAVDDALFAMQAYDVTQLLDENADDRVEATHVVADGWRRTSFYRQYAFGLAYRDGAFFGGLSRPVDASGAMMIEPVPDAGLLVRLDFSRSYTPLVSGLQMPNGMALDAEGNLVAADYQNAWFGASRLVQVPAADLDRTSPMPADSVTLCWMPPLEVSVSPSQPLPITQGPYAGQLLVGDTNAERLFRVSREEVDGVAQGAVYRFASDIGFRANRLVEGEGGVLFAGAARFGSIWGIPDADDAPTLYALAPADARPFELYAMRLRPGGFELEFSEPVDPAAAGRLASYTLDGLSGRNRSGVRRLEVAAVKRSDDGKRIWLDVPSLEAGEVIYLTLDPEMRSTAGDRLWSNEAWYTVNALFDAARADTASVVR
ncbi:MAG: PA14 domain-containing protein [Rhodothermales bacterium]